MKIAVTSKGNNLDSEVDPRFGRAAYIIIVDTETFEFEAVDNSVNVNSFKGAGIQTGAMVAGKKAEALLTGFCGPNAFKTLNAANVKVANNVTGTIKEAVQAFKDGKVTFADEANTDGHW